MAKNDQVFHQELEVHLTDEELARKRDELAAAVQRMAQVEIEKHEKTSVFNRELKSLLGQSKQLAGQISARAEQRPVKCRRVQDAERFKVAVVRMDTMECTEVRDMTDSEVERVRQSEQVQLDAEIAGAIKAFERQIKGDAAAAADKAAAEEEGQVAAESPAAPEAQAEPGGFRLEDVPHVSAKVAKAVREAGFGSLDALRGAVPDDLTKVKGVGPAVAEKILLYVEENFPMDAEGLNGHGEAEAVGATVLPWRGNGVGEVVDEDPLGIGQAAPSGDDRSEGGPRTTGGDDPGGEDLLPPLDGEGVPEILR